MGTDKQDPLDYLADSELDETDMAFELQEKRDAVRSAETEFAKCIVRAHDKAGFTFREIGEATGIAHSFIYHLYRRTRKDKGRPYDSGLRGYGNDRWTRSDREEGGG